MRFVHFIKVISTMTLIVMIASCSNKEKRNTESIMPETMTFPEKRTVEIDFNGAEPITKHFKKVGNIIFDEDTEEIIGGIQQMIVRGDTIYAVDPAKNPGLYAYLKDGSQIFAYCNQGGGPEDISSPMSLTINDTEILPSCLRRRRQPLSYTSGRLNRHPMPALIVLNIYPER